MVALSRAILLYFLVISSHCSVFASSEKPQDNSMCNSSKILHAINDYFNSNVNIIAKNAAQIDGNGRVPVQFYWQNYKIAIFFGKPINAKVWIDRKNVYYLDEALGQCNNVKTKNSVAKILTSELQLSEKSEDIAIRKYHCSIEDAKVTINFVDKKHPNDGTMEMSFSVDFTKKNPVIVGIDYLKNIPKESEQTTMLVLEKTESNIDIDKSIFNIPVECTKSAK